MIHFPSTSRGLLKACATVLQLVLVLPFAEVEDLSKLLDNVLVYQRFFKSTSKHIIHVDANHANDPFGSQTLARVRGLNVGEVSLADEEAARIQHVRAQPN